MSDKQMIEFLENFDKFLETKKQKKKRNHKKIPKIKYIFQKIRDDLFLNKYDLAINLNLLRGILSNDDRESMKRKLQLFLHLWIFQIVIFLTFGKNLENNNAVLIFLLILTETIGIILYISTMNNVLFNKEETEILLDSLRDIIKKNAQLNTINLDTSSNYNMEFDNEEITLVRNDASFDLKNKLVIKLNESIEKIEKIYS